eukprot:scaffold520_cov224-Pinguiococcus_pyrenoidosus.AAC.11
MVLSKPEGVPCTMVSATYAQSLISTSVSGGGTRNSALWSSSEGSPVMDSPTIFLRRPMRAIADATQNAAEDPRPAPTGSLTRFAFTISPSTLSGSSRIARQRYSSGFRPCFAARS